MKSNNTLILVADSENIYFYKNTGVNKGIEKVKPEFHQTLPPNREIASDRYGQRKTGEGAQAMKGATHDYQYSHSPKEDKRVKFLREGVEYADDKIRRKDYSRMVIIAPPQTLGDIRKLLSDNLKKCIHAEIDKELTNSKPKDIERQLEPVMAV